MNDVDYKPNSHKYREQQKAQNEKRAQKVVKGAVKVQKKTGVSKLADIFISEDANNVKSYVVMDVLIPAVKKAITDIVTNGIEMILYGETGNRNRSTNASYVSYRSYSDRRDDRRSSSDYRTRYSYDNIVLESRGEAEEVLRRMDEILDTYQMVRVADLYDLVGVSGEHTDNKYGWTNLSTARVERGRDGYRLKLPRALPID